MFPASAYPGILVKAGGSLTSLQYGTNDTGSNMFNSSQHQQPPQTVKSEGHTNHRPNYPSFFLLIDTAVYGSGIPGTQPPWQCQPPALSPSAVERNWQHVVPLKQPAEAPSTLMTSFPSSSAPSSAASAHPSTAPWVSLSSPTMPTPTSEHSSSLNDLTIIPYDPRQSGSASSSDDRGPVTSRVVLVIVKESNKSRPPPAYQNPQVPATDSPPVAAPVDNDPVPRRGRRPVRKRASEQQLHDQQQRHQHQFHLQHPPPQRNSRTRYRHSSAATAHEIGPLRGFGAAREETSRRKSSIMSASSKGDSDSPLLKSGTHQMVCGSVSLNVRARYFATNQNSFHALKKPTQPHRAELPSQGAPMLCAQLFANVYQKCHRKSRHLGANGAQAFLFGVNPLPKSMRLLDTPDCTLQWQQRPRNNS
jgi:hypothetical protein